MKKIDKLLKDLTSSSPKVKYSAGKEMMNIAYSTPELLYPYFDKIKEFINGSNNIIKWNAIRTIGFLPKADKDRKIKNIIPLFFKQLRSRELITINNTILALSEIAENEQELRWKIMEEFLNVPKYKFPTSGCRNIAIGKIIEVLGKFQAELKDQNKYIEFIKSASKNSRNATRKKANILLNKFS